MIPGAVFVDWLRDLEQGDLSIALATTALALIATALEVRGKKCDLLCILNPSSPSVGPSGC